ncbi:hypothetical protein ACWXVO_01520 [Mycoplasma sp. 1890]
MTNKNNFFCKLKKYPKLKRNYIFFLALCICVIIIPIILITAWIVYLILNNGTHFLIQSNNFIVLISITSILFISWLTCFFLIRYIIKITFAKIYKITKNKIINKIAIIFLGEKIMNADIHMINQELEENNKNQRL